MAGLSPAIFNVYKTRSEMLWQVVLSNIMHLGGYLEALAYETSVTKSSDPLRPGNTLHPS